MTAGKPFRINKTPSDAHHTGHGTAILNRAELDRPSCPSCFVPGFDAGYCTRCTTSGAAERHRTHPHRQEAP